MFLNIINSNSSNNNHETNKEHTKLLSLILILFVVFILVIFYRIFYLNNSNNEFNESFKSCNVTRNVCKTPNNTYKILSKNFYTVDEVCPELKLIYQTLPKIRTEVAMVKNEEWTDWPEKELYDGKNNFVWNIYPFTAFGIIVKENCRRCPTLWRFLQKIPGLKVATLSRLGPGVKLNTHQGWGHHSNNVIRCHFGIEVPYGCYVSVRNNLNDAEEIRLHKQNDWILFDDSRHHYAHNPTNRDRIVLIVDVERPENIKSGTSTGNDTKELQQIISYFRSTNRLG